MIVSGPQLELASIAHGARVFDGATEAFEDRRPDYRALLRLCHFLPPNWRPRMQNGVRRHAGDHLVSPTDVDHHRLRGDKTLNGLVICSFDLALLHCRGHA